MKFFEKIYTNLCESKKDNIINYGRGSNIHKHHITPKHRNGTDEPHNLTYLSIREHILAHFLLWKIYKDPNDLRSMKMLGAKLSHNQRKEIGIFCKNNKIGFWGASKEERKEWRLKGFKTQKSRQIGIHDPIKHKEYAKLGGEASFASGNNEKFMFWASDEGRKARASLGVKHI